MLKKKVLMVGPYPPTIGGITTFILTLLKSDLNNKYEFIPFTTSRPTVGVIKDNYNYELFIRIGFNNLIKSFLFTLNHIIKFPIILLINNPKIIHINTTDYWPFWEGSIYVLISNFFFKRIILHIHATSFEEFYASGNFFIKFLIKKTLLMVDKIIILSNRQKKFFMNLVPKQNLHVIHNFVKTSNLLNAADVSSNESKITRVLFIGGEEAKRKGIYDVIESIPLVVKDYGEKTLFIIIGRCDVNRLKKLCKKMKIEKYVNFLGYVEESIKIKFLTSSNIFVLPSYAEGLPIAILEAMASGLPVISTHVGSIPEIIENDVNGYLIKPGDYSALANKIILLALNPKLRQIMGERNKEKILKEYDIKILKDKFNNLYNEFV